MEGSKRGVQRNSMNDSRLDDRGLSEDCLTNNLVCWNVLSASTNLDLSRNRSISDVSCPPPSWVFSNKYNRIGLAFCITKEKRNCNSRESNPGLIRGRDLSYHLTTIALFSTQIFVSSAPSLSQVVIHDIARTYRNDATRSGDRSVACCDVSAKWVDLLMPFHLDPISGF